MGNIVSDLLLIAKKCLAEDAREEDGSTLRTGIMPETAVNQNNPHLDNKFSIKISNRTPKI